MGSTGGENRDVVAAKMLSATVIEGNTTQLGAPHVDTVHSWAEKLSWSSKFGKRVAPCSTST